MWPGNKAMRPQIRSRVWQRDKYCKVIKGPAGTLRTPAGNTLLTGINMNCVRCLSTLSNAYLSWSVSHTFLHCRSSMEEHCMQEFTLLLFTSFFTFVMLFLGYCTADICKLFTYYWSCFSADRFHSGLVQLYGMLWGSKVTNSSFTCNSNSGQCL